MAQIQQGLAQMPGQWHDCTCVPARHDLLTQSGL
jgi:hypothetical protein